MEDVDHLGIDQLAQRRLLQGLLEKAHRGCPSQSLGASAARPPHIPTQEPMDDISTQLRALFDTMPQADATPAVPAATQGERVDLNPLSYLLPKQKPKYKDITDYISEAQGMDEKVLLGEAGCEVVLRSGGKKTQLDAVTPSQYMGASIKILMDLLRDGLLLHCNIFDYLAYMVKISELTASHVWASVLQFDRAYRQLQAQHGFRWAADTPHLVAVHLRPRGQAQVAQASPRGGTRPSTGTPTSRRDDTTVCRLYNGNRCPFGPACRYRHVCSAPGCHGSHPLALHGKTNSGPTTGANQSMLPKN